MNESKMPEEAGHVREPIGRNALRPELLGKNAYTSLSRNETLIDEIIVEYLMLYLKDSHDFDRLNTLSFHLLLRLPAEQYLALGQALSSGPDSRQRVYEWLCAYRTAAGSVPAERVIYHAHNMKTDPPAAIPIRFGTYEENNDGRD